MEPCAETTWRPSGVLPGGTNSSNPSPSSGESSANRTPRSSGDNSAEAGSIIPNQSISVRCVRLFREFLARHGRNNCYPRRRHPETSCPQIHLHYRRSWPVGPNDETEMARIAFACPSKIRVSWHATMRRAPWPMTSCRCHKRQFDKMGDCSLQNLKGG